MAARLSCALRSCCAYHLSPRIVPTLKVERRPEFRNQSGFLALRGPT